MILFPIIISLLLVAVLKLCYSFTCSWKFFQALPGEESFHLLLGNVHLVPGNNEAGLNYDFKLISRFKYFHRFWAGPFVPVIMCYHPSVVRTVLKSSAPKPRGSILCTPYDMGFRWIGEGLLLSNGQKWSRNRRLLTPAFHFDILKNYVDVYHECAKIFLSKLETLQGKSFDVFAPVSLCTLDVILRTAFSYHSDCQVTSEQNVYTQSLTELVTLWTERNYNPFLFIEFVYGLTPQGRRFYKLCQVVHQFGENVIEQRRAALETSPHNISEEVSHRFKIRDFLDTLLMAQDENGHGLTPLEIRNEVDTFLFEGHDTTTTGISWTLYILASNPECQEKVYQEVVTVLDGREKLDWSDMTRLEYTTMCIKEAMRLHTVVPFIERRLNESLELNGHVIPEGTLVGVHIWNLHHNPHVWDQPYEYDPERFNAENLSKQDPFQFLPFSAGSRNCIGQNFAMNEMRVIVSSVVKNFKLESDEEDKPRKVYSVTIKTENGAKIYASRRH